jgi:hypothetical protein
LIEIDAGIGRHVHVGGAELWALLRKGADGEKREEKDQTHA